MLRITEGEPQPGPHRSRLVTALLMLAILSAGCGDAAAEPGVASPGRSVAPAGASQHGSQREPGQNDQHSDSAPPIGSTISSSAAADQPEPADPGTGLSNQATASETTKTTKPLGSIIHPVFMFPAAEGDSGESVLHMQRRLDNLGFAPGSPDGSYGKRTVAAVEAFQGLVGLPETGVADDDTIAALSTFYYDGPILRAGDEGSDVEVLQQRLADGPFDPGPIDGDYGTGTVQAVWALEKLAGIPVDGSWGPLDEAALEELLAGGIGSPTESHDLRWVEVDLSEQLIKVYDPGQSLPTLVSHASSGSGIPWSNEEHSGSSITPTGNFEIQRRISGWRESSLNIGRLYNPLYFRGGIAFHGASSVPLYPASHGCVRLPMHVAEYLPDLLPNGTPVHVTA